MFLRKAAGWLRWVAATGGVALTFGLLAGCGDDDPEGKSVAAEGSVTLQAGDIYWDITEIKTKPGDLAITIEETGVQSHTLLFDEIDGFKIGVDARNKTATGTITLEAGTYNYYCSVPGHRAQGMFGQIIVAP